MERERYNKRKIEEVKEIVNNLGYGLLGEYQKERGGIRSVIIQDSDGYKYDVLLSNIMKGQIPDFVNKGNPFTLSHIISQYSVMA